MTDAAHAFAPLDAFAPWGWGPPGHHRLHKHGFKGCGGRGGRGWRGGRGHRGGHLAAEGTRDELSVPLPGLAPADVTLELSPANVLTVHAEPHLRCDVQLSADVEASKVTASLVEGMLKVKTPPKQPVQIPVTAAAPPAAADATAEGGDASVRREVPVPGVPASAVRVEVTGHDVTLRFDDGRGAAVVLHFGPAADPAAAQAWCQHGLLTLVVPKAAPVEVPITAQRAEEGGAEERVLVETAVPGVAPEDVSVTARGHVLLIKTPQGRARLVCDDAGAAAGLRAECQDGVLRVLCPRAAPRVIAVSDRDDAPSTAAAAEHDAAEGAVEDADSGDDWEEAATAALMAEAQSAVARDGIVIEAPAQEDIDQ